MRSILTALFALVLLFSLAGCALTLRPPIGGLF